MVNAVPVLYINDLYMFHECTWRLPCSWLLGRPQEFWHTQKYCYWKLFPATDKLYLQYFWINLSCPKHIHVHKLKLRGSSKKSEDEDILSHFLYNGKTYSKMLYQSLSQYDINGLVLHLIVGVVHWIMASTYLHLINLCEGVGWSVSLDTVSLDGGLLLQFLLGPWFIRIPIYKCINTKYCSFISICLLLYYCWES